MDLSELHHYECERRKEEERFALPIFLSVVPHAFVVFRKLPAPHPNRYVRVRLALYKWGQHDNNA